MESRWLIFPAVALVIALAATGAARAAGVQGSNGPGCTEGPQIVDGTVRGTPCDDRIVAPPGVTAVSGGGGDDTIVAAPITSASSCPEGCRLGVGSQTFEGGPGDDVVYGERGNDRLLGGEGADQLFGGIGDDLLAGGPGDDRLSGGFGADSTDGEGGDDYVSGDATQDTILDTGGGADTLSYATGVTPGFPNNAAYPNFSAVPNLPGVGGERGVYINLADAVGDNGVAPLGGGVDSIEGGSFETVIGTPYSDYIVGGEKGETVYSGGGGDVIRGGGGNDTLRGGADGDDIDGGAGANNVDGGAGSDHCANPTAGAACESGANKGGVVLRDPSKVSVGVMAPEASGHAELYLTGSDSADAIVATYVPGPPASVTFTLGSAGFDGSASASSACNPPSGSQVVCPFAQPLDSLALAGLGGSDNVETKGFPASVSIVISGGNGGDTLSGADASEDVLVDGPDSGADTLYGFGGDDALLNNAGADKLYGGVGNDLFLSNETCDGDVLDGGAGSERDNASWAKFKASVEARVDTGDVGDPGAGGAPECPGGKFDSLIDIEDLEGTSSGDVLYGDSGNNQLLGWAGSDSYFAGAGTDLILANSADQDATIDCGEDDDTALVDRQPIDDAAPVDCETVQEADPNDFRVKTELPEPEPEPEPEPKPKPEPEPPLQLPPTVVQFPPAPQPPSRSPRVCLSRSIGDRPLCAERPSRLALGSRGYLTGIRWRRWGARKAAGFARLEITVGCCDRRGADHARVIVSGLRSCGSQRWYTRLSVSYGRGYRKQLARRLISAAPCG